MPTTKLLFSMLIKFGDIFFSPFSSIFICLKLSDVFLSVTQAPECLIVERIHEREHYLVKHSLVKEQIAYMYIYTYLSVIQCF